ncbi:helix-turn-helix transcriptional regulator [Saccharopolyspora hattusasensis]|uniref:helix-turn-helix transcriptional regulator n=1 Tax=Saccharopolyspora hattusasensis TaxID=1128679 RepID=UPI003D989582
MILNNGELPVPYDVPVGRGELIEQVKTALDSWRHVTLIGVPGVGKSTVALQVAWFFQDSTELTSEFDTIRWIALNDIEDIDQLDEHQIRARVTDAVAAAVGVVGNGTTDLAALIIEKVRSLGRVLLVFDNCEHVKAGAAFLAAELLSSCLQLKILTTSQHVLELSSERVIPVHPLEVPSKDHSADTSEAVELLVARAQQRRDTFTLTPENTADVERLAQIGAGIPLVLGVFGKQVAASSPRDFLAWLSRHPDGVLLVRGGDRVSKRSHETLAHALQCMWDLLEEKERVAWARLSIFAGRFHRDVAAAVIADGTVIAEYEVHGVMTGLVDKSVLQQVQGLPADFAEYSLLGPLKAKGAQEFAQRGETEEVFDRLLGHYESLAERCRREWAGADELDWMRFWRDDQLNLETVLRYATVHAPARGLRLLLDILRARGALYDGFIKHSRRWLVELLESLSDQDNDAELMATGFAIAGWLRSHLGEHDGAREDLAEAARYEELSGSVQPYVTYLRGLSAWWDDRRADEAMLILQEAVTQFKNIGDAGGEYMASHYRGMCYASEADVDRARPVIDELLAEAQSVAGVWGISWARYTETLYLLRCAEQAGERGNVAEERKALAAASEAITAVTQLWVDIRDRWSPVYGATCLGLVLAAQRQHRSAAVILGAAQMATERVDVEVALPGWADRTAQTLASCKAVLGADAFAAAFAEGHSLGDLAVLAATGTEGVVGTGPLSPAEWEVVRLLPTGATNGQIAQYLGKSRRTVEDHLNKARKKLQLPMTRDTKLAREQLVDWSRKQSGSSVLMLPWLPARPPRAARPLSVTGGHYGAGASVNP